MLRLGLIFRVEDDDIVAARKLQGVVARLGLGARLRRWHQHQLHIGLEPQLFCHGDGIAVIGLEDQLDVELGARIVQPPHGARQQRQNLRLLIKRHQDRIDRQVLVLRQIMIPLPQRLRRKTKGDGNAAQDQERQKEQPQHRVDHDRRQPRRRHDADKDRHGNHAEHHALRRGQPAAGGKFRLPLIQCQPGAVLQHGFKLPLQRPQHVQPRGDGKAEIVLRRRQAQRPPFGNHACRHQRVGRRQHQPRPLPADGDCFCRLIEIKMLGLEQPGVRRGLQHIDEGQVQMPRQHPVERLRGDEAQRQHRLAQRHIPCRRRAQRLDELLFGDQPGVPQHRPQRLPQRIAGHGSVRHGLPSHYCLPARAA